MLSQRQRDLDRIFNAREDVPIQPAMVTNEPRNLNRPNLLGLGNAIQFQSSRTLGNLSVARIKTLDIGRIGDGHHYDNGTICIDGIAADDDNRPCPCLFTALGGVEPSAEHITANGFWKCGSLAAHAVA